MTAEIPILAPEGDPEVSTPEKDETQKDDRAGDITSADVAFSPEQKPDYTSSGAYADRYLSRAEDGGGDPLSLQGYADDFIEALVRRARGGNIASGVYGGVISPDKLLSILTDFELVADERRAAGEKIPANMIPSADKLREAIVGIQTSNPVFYKAYRDALNDRVELEKKKRELALMPKEVAETALESVGVNEPEGPITHIPDTILNSSNLITPETPVEEKTIDEKIDDITRGLSEGDKRNLIGYARNKALKKDAQNSGDGQGSMTYGQNMGRHFNELSDEARAIKDTVAALYAAKWG